MRLFTMSILSATLCVTLAAGCTEQSGGAGAEGVSQSGEAGGSTNPGSSNSPSSTARSGQSEAGGADAAGSSSSAGESSSSVSPASVALTPENTTIEFTGSKPSGESHDGGFGQFEGEIGLNPEDGSLESLSIELQTASLWAKPEKLENHLKTADFFNVREYPKASFQSTAIEKGEAGSYTVTGDLTLHGETKEIQFPVTVTGSGSDFALESEFTFDRMRFGIDHGEGEINDEVEVRVTVGK